MHHLHDGPRFDQLRGVFSDPGVEQAYREEHLERHVRQARRMWMAGQAVWMALLLVDLAIGAWTRALYRLGVAAVLAGFAIRPRTPEGADRWLMGSMIMVALGIAGVFPLAGTSDAFVVGYLLLLVIGEACWPVLPTAKQAVVTVVTIAAMGVVLAARGHEPLRVVTFGALCACWTLVLHAGTSIRDRRLQAEVWRTADLVAARERMMAAIAHELRTPLASALMATDLGLKLPGREIEYLERLRPRLLHLRALTEALLRFGGLGAGEPLHVERVAVGPLLAGIAAELGELAPTLAVHAEGDAAVDADATLLRSAIVALGGNATRFARTRIELAVRDTGAEVTIDVDDDGPGVPADRRQEILEPFARLGPRDGHSGIGMGLAIAHRIVLAHGGALRVGDSPLAGARVTLVFPSVG